jgi:hypothetical protein
MSALFDEDINHAGSAVIYDDHPVSVLGFEEQFSREKVGVTIAGEVPHLMKILNDIENKTAPLPNLFLFDVHVDGRRGLDSLGVIANHSCKENEMGFYLAEQLVFGNQTFDGIPVFFFSEKPDVPFSPNIRRLGKDRTVGFFHKSHFDQNLPKLLRSLARSRKAHVTHANQPPFTPEEYWRLLRALCRSFGLTDNADVIRSAGRDQALKSRNPRDLFMSRDARDRVEILMQIQGLFFALNPKRRKFVKEAKIPLEDLGMRSLAGVMLNGTISELHLYRAYLEARTGGHA